MYQNIMIKIKKKKKMIKLLKFDYESLFVAPSIVWRSLLLISHMSLGCLHDVPYTSCTNIYQKIVLAL